MGAYAPLNHPIGVVPYDPRWPHLYEEERVHIAAALGGRGARFEHIGSTAVPGLAAKPVIDIAIGIERLDEAGRYLPILVRLGYTYVPRLETELPQRRFLWRVDAGGQRYYVSLTKLHGPLWESPIAFRDYLREHPADAAKYARLKEQLALECGSDIGTYVRGKTEFIRQVLEKAQAVTG